ncbi:hypothetical protein [Entomomonas asaccharolytica]|uniref:Uncharacterized protein n=1 Tax=Entomomonas asaccharolytica TaxID=2785331 RepID=A0A974RWE0_9GAMM|nr:hypothetical protein [Entomomonas asaccharolytica]QQP85027.1 hypothetical protein JHT90_11605 [Entomomonas asaccharolytica]
MINTVTGIIIALATLASVCFQFTKLPEHTKNYFKSRFGYYFSFSICLAVAAYFVYLSIDFGLSNKPINRFDLFLPPLYLFNIISYLILAKLFHSSKQEILNSFEKPYKETVKNKNESKAHILH